MVILTGIFVLRPVVNRVVNQKLNTLNLFLLVPRDVVVKMSKKTAKLQNILHKQRNSTNNTQTINNTNKTRNDKMQNL